MAQATKARVVACTLLSQVRRRGAYARDLLRTSEAMQQLNETDRALTSRLVLGVVASCGLLDEVVNAHLAKGAKLEPKVRDAMRLGAYELLFLSTPASAAVSQAVELVRSARPRAAGLANAVLRKVAAKDVPRRVHALEAAQKGNADRGTLSLASGYPAWLLQKVTEDRGVEAARGLALSALDPAPVYVTASCKLHKASLANQLLEDAGLSPQETELKGTFALGRPGGLGSSDLVEAVDVVVADLSAVRIARRVAALPGASVLEIGQGRGTKTLLMLSAAAEKGKNLRVVGLDSQKFKVDVARRRMRRAGVDESVTCVCCDAREVGTAKSPKAIQGSFNTVFVDAPCSGTGTLRRHPEIAWALRPADVDALAALQLSILKQASSAVEQGGALCYATCSVLRAEDEDVVAAFLKSAEGSGFSLEGNTWLSLPAQDMPDGHFCAVMRRVV